LIVEPVLNEIINIAEERGISAPDASEAEGWTVRSLAATAQKAMEAAKQRDATGRVSFDDMVWLPVAAGWVKPVFELVVVDEAQDMNLPQLIMAERASKGRICVVGDDRQAIYGFRGAASDGLAMMERKLGAARLGLTTTYRCPKSVVNLAQSIVTDYHAAPEAPEGQVVSLSVDSAISDLAPGDAVLSRLNAPLASIALGLLRKGIPARVEGRDIGKTLVAAVRKLRAKSVPDFLRKLEAQTEKQIARITARGGKSAPVKIEQVNDQSETLTAIAEGCTNVEEVESRIKNLFEDSDRSRKPAVVCSSVHKAKGLEWNKVVLLQYTFKRKGQLQLAGEEGNVYYVAVTRAKKILVIAED
jgi:superfamily I DNA/RNA helicase